MKRYLRILVFLFRLNMSSILAYRANFINSFVINFGWGVVSLLQIIILTNKASSVYGWSRYELFLFAGIYSIVIGIFHIFFSSNFERFARISHYGQMDGYLIKPIDSQFLLTCSIMRPLHIFRIFLGIGFILFVLSIMHIQLSPLDIIYFCVLIIGSIGILYSFWSLVVTLTVWYTNLSNLPDVLYNVTNIGRYPPALLFKTGNLILFLLIPLTLISSVPGKALIHKISFLDVSMLFFFATVLFYASRKFFIFALRSYTSASS